MRHHLASRADNHSLVFVLAVLLMVKIAHATGSSHALNSKSEQLDRSASRDLVNLIPVDQPLSVDPDRSAKSEQLNNNSGAEQEQLAIQTDQAELQLQQQQQPDEQNTRATTGEVNALIMNQLTAQRADRRLGLLKKGHYGAPMAMPVSSAPAMSSYLTASSSDCERCLASMNQQAFSAEYQQVPLEQPVSPPASVIPAMPNSYPTPAVHPFKSKLFMKFPFFMKSPMSQPLVDYGHPSGPDYWTNQQTLPVPSPPVMIRPQPGHSGALFVRPAHAYNCVQAAPLLASPSIQQTELVSPALNGAGKTSGSALKQQQHQFGAHHQQQQVSYSSGSY